MNRSKTALFVALGIVFWFSGAMTVKLLGTNALTEHNPNLIWAFLLVIPITVVTLVIAKNIGRLAYSELMRPVIIMTITATFFDGIALTWFRQLYGDSFEVALHGAALILWGAGLGLLFAYMLENRRA